MDSRPTMTIRLTALALAGIMTLFAVGCGEAKRPGQDRTGFENAIGAIVVDELLKETQAEYPDEQEPLPYALVVGERLAPTSSGFLKRFRDQGHQFLSADQLDYDRVTKATVIKGSRTNPVVLQLAKITQLAPDRHEVATAWNRDAKVVRKTYLVEGLASDEGALKVSAIPSSQSSG